MDTRRVARATVRGLDASVRDFGAVVKLSDNRSIRARQKAAFDKYRARLTQRTASITEGIETALNGAQVEMPALERVSVVLGVLKYWAQYLAFWILGLGIDFAAPLPLVLLLHPHTPARLK